MTHILRLVTGEKPDTQNTQKTGAWTEREKSDKQRKKKPENTTQQGYQISTFTTIVSMIH